MNAARSILVSSRPLSWVNTGFPFAAAYLMTAREVDVVFVVGTLYFLIPYNIGLYGINDVFDYESDLRNPRKGGAEGALLEPSIHRIILLVAVIANVPFLIFLVAVGTVPSTVVLAISVFALVAYSAPRFRFKERPFLDSITSSTHFVSPAVFGLALAGAAPTPQLVVLLTAFFLWGIASHAFGAVQDIVADRDAHLRSIAIAIGGRATVRLAFACYLLAGVLLVFTGFPGQIAGVLMLPYAVNLLPYWSVRDAEAGNANRGWKRFLALNFVTGFLVTILLVWYAALPAGGPGA
jgi:4-hydroxybenzoate polyprenyltransferase